MNQAMLVGNLGSNGDLRFCQDGTPVMNLNLATSEYFKDKSGERQQRTQWHRVSIFGRVAEALKDHLTKGRQVLIQGMIENRRWTDSDGIERFSTNVVVRPGRGVVQLLNRPRSESAEQVTEQQEDEVIAEL